MPLLLARTSSLARVLAVLRPTSRASLGRGATFTARVLRVILPRKILRPVWQESNTLVAVDQPVGPMALEAAPTPTVTSPTGPPSTQLALAPKRGPRRSVLVHLGD